MEKIVYSIHCTKDGFFLEVKTPQGEGTYQYTKFTDIIHDLRDGSVPSFKSGKQTSTMQKQFDPTADVTVDIYNSELQQSSRASESQQGSRTSASQQGSTSTLQQGSRTQQGQQGSVKKEISVNTPKKFQWSHKGFKSSEPKPIGQVLIDIKEKLSIRD